MIEEDRWTYKEEADEPTRQNDDHDIGDSLEGRTDKNTLIEQYYRYFYKSKTGLGDKEWCPDKLSSESITFPLRHRTLVSTLE